SNTSTSFTPIADAVVILTISSNRFRFVFSGRVEGADDASHHASGLPRAPHPARSPRAPGTAARDRASARTREVHVPPTRAMPESRLKNYRPMPSAGIHRADSLLGAADRASATRR